MNLNYNTLVKKPIWDLVHAKMQLAYKMFIAIAAIILFTTSTTEASHYRYGNISWNRVNDATRTVTFNVTTAWRSSFFTSPTPTVGAVINAGTVLNFGDGATTSILFTVTSVNVPENWFVGTATVTHTYPGAATSFTAFYSSNARIGSPMQNNTNLTFRSETTVMLVPGNTYSPVSNLPAIINLPVGQAAAAFNVPAFDPDGQSLTYALALPAQVSGGGTQSTNPTGLAIHPTSGAATFNTSGKTVGQMWNGFFSITDASGSTTIVDFIMLMVAPNSPPVFNYSVTPANNFVYSISPGQNVTFPIEVSCPDAGSTVTLTATGLPGGNYTFTPALPETGNPVSSTFSFTPAFAQLGTYVMTFTATRDGGVQTSTTVVVNVNTNPAFVAPSPIAGSTFVIPTGVLHQDVLAASNPDPMINTSINTASIPAGASVSPAVPTAFAATSTTTLSWTPAPADFGAHTVTFVAIDDNGRIAGRSYILWPNTVPVFTSGSRYSGVECTPYSYDIAVDDPDLAYGDVLEIKPYTPLPAWLTLTDHGDGTAVLAGTPPPGSAGTYAINIIAEDTWHHAHPDVVQSFTLMIGADATAPVLSGVPADVTVQCDAIPAVASVTAFDDCAGSLPVSFWEGPSIPVKLSHLWKADGDFTDAVGSADGTPFGSVSFGSPILGSNSFSFNGSAGYVGTGTAGSVSGTGNFAVSAWIKTTSASPMVIMQQRDQNFIGEYILKVGGNHCNCDIRPGKLYFLVYGSGSPVVDLFSTTDVNDGKWHHVMGEREGSDVRLYIDGALVSSGSTGVVVNMNGTIKTSFGRDIRNNNSNFDGLIDDLRVWTAADCPSTYEFDRNWLAEDASSNQVAAVQHIKVEDNDAPALTGILPAGESGMNLCKSAAPDGPSASDIAALYSDNCGTVHVVKSGIVAGANDSWSVIYTYDVYDDCNHHVTPSPTIAYDGGDQSAPVPDLPVLATVTGECSAAVTTAPTATDNCEGAINGTTSDPLTYSTQGTHTITWTYDDGNGNTSVQTQTVIVNDVTPPVALCKDFILNLSGGTGTVTPMDIDNGSSDNCEIVSMSVSPDTFTCSDAGQHLVTLTVTDINSNVSSCISTVTVQYQPSCSITAVPSAGAVTGGPSTTIYLGYGPQSVTLASSVTGGSGFTYSWSGLSASSTALLSCTSCASPLFTPTSEGRYQFTLTVTNSNGCSTTCEITICVLDVKVPGTNGKKVYLCHVPPGNPGNPQTLSISVNAVPAHIPGHTGDHLGTCEQSCESLGIKAGTVGELVVSESGSFETIVYPNPFTTDFTVKVETESREQIRLNIFDLAGKKLIEVTDITPDTPYKVSNNLNEGFYLLQIQQGTDVQNIKIIKRK
ncbi:MAG: LamG-like jellyroll fold domain-containing protein [Bacteroidales bacterium]|nr:LamG-like jellyroll fold domain-containing protein [Bacteroidales bacterium]